MTGRLYEILSRVVMHGLDPRIHEFFCLLLLLSGSSQVIKSSRREERTMKFKVDIDCTPDEARAFFGLPDVKPLQEALLPEVEERLRATLKAMDPEAMLKTWLPATLKGFEQLQEMFLSQLGGLGKKK